MFKNNVFFQANVDLNKCNKLKQLFRYFSPTGLYHLPTHTCQVTFLCSATLGTLYSERPNTGHLITGLVVLHGPII
jgi:hypothetical protein